VRSPRLDRMLARGASRGELVSGVPRRQAADLVAAAIADRMATLALATPGSDRPRP
jgi:hypothetical protein